MIEEKEEMIDDEEEEFDDGYDPDSFQERWLREYIRKRERKRKIKRMFGLRTTKPMDLSWWDNDEHCWIVNKLHHAKEKFKESPVIPVTIVYSIIILLLTYFFDL